MINISKKNNLIDIKIFYLRHFSRKLNPDNLLIDSKIIRAMNDVN